MSENNEEVVSSTEKKKPKLNEKQKSFIIGTLVGGTVVALGVTVWDRAIKVGYQKLIDKTIDMVDESVKRVTSIPSIDFTSETLEKFLKPKAITI